MNEEFPFYPEGIVLVGIIIGVLAALLQKLGNPGNMGICVACFIGIQPVGWVSQGGNCPVCTA